MTDTTERREQAGRRLLDGHTHQELAAFVAGCDWQHKATIADVVAWLRIGAEKYKAASADHGGPVGISLGHVAEVLDEVADAIERGEVEGAAE